MQKLDSSDKQASATPPDNVLNDSHGYPLAVGLNRFGHREVVAYDPESGLVRFMHRWSPWAPAGAVPEDCVSFVGWVVPS